MIRIKSEGGNAAITEITTEDGAPIDGIKSVSVSFDAEKMVTAEVFVMVGRVDVMAHPLLGLDTLQEAAAVHGYKLVPDA